MTQEQKDWIDKSDYETLLELWRFAPIGHPMFKGDTGDYYKRVMFEKRDNLEDKGVSASKNIGWDE